MNSRRFTAQYLSCLDRRIAHLAGVLRAGDEDDGDCRGCRLGRKRRDTSERGDRGDLPANQIGRQFRQPIDLILGEAVYDRHVLTLDIAALFEALTVCAQTLRDRV
jgi:hypothetical protein